MAAYAKSRKLSSSKEDYLEAILCLVRQNRVARVRDIALRLGVGMSSVTSALKVLSKRELVNYDPYQFVTLSDRGRHLAEQISRRHDDLRSFLAEVLGLPAQVAEANACRMEHAMDDEVLERFRALAEFVTRCPRAGKEWIKSFQQRFSQGRCGPAGSCRQCLAGAVRRFRKPGDASGEHT